MKNKRFEESFLKYKDLIIKLAVSKTGNFQTAQEICQQVFLSFYKNMDRVDKDLEKAWLIRATKNAIVDFFRKNRNHKEVPMNHDLKEMGNVLVEESISLHEKQMYQKEFTGRILREVRKANYLWYEVLVMICVDGISYSEAARRLGIAEPVLRARLYRARNFVRERFGNEYLDM